MVGVTVKLTPLQEVVFIVVITGEGFTVIVNTKGVPVHPFAAGVTVQVAVFTALVALVSVPVILEPLLATPPVIPVPIGAVQL